MSSIDTISKLLWAIDRAMNLSVESSTWVEIEGVNIKSDWLESNLWHNLVTLSRYNNVFFYVESSSASRYSCSLSSDSFTNALRWPCAFFSNSLGESYSTWTEISHQLTKSTKDNLTIFPASKTIYLPDFKSEWTLKYIDHVQFYQRLALSANDGLLR